MDSCWRADSELAENMALWDLLCDGEFGGPLHAGSQWFRVEVKMGCIAYLSWRGV